MNLNILFFLIFNIISNYGNIILTFIQSLLYNIQIILIINSYINILSFLICNYLLEIFRGEKLYFLVYNLIIKRTY